MVALAILASSSSLRLSALSITAAESPSEKGSVPPAPVNVGEALNLIKLVAALPSVSPSLMLQVIVRVPTVGFADEFE